MFHASKSAVFSSFLERLRGLSVCHLGNFGHFEELLLGVDSNCLRSSGFAQIWSCHLTVHQEALAQGLLRESDHLGAKMGSAAGLQLETVLLKAKKMVFGRKTTLADALSMVGVGTSNNSANPRVKQRPVGTSSAR